MAAGRKEDAMRNRIVIIAALVGAVLAAAVYAQHKGGGVKPLTALDYAELQQLYATYYQTADSGVDDCMAWAKLFTPDAVFFVGEKKTADGRQELAAFCRTGTGTAPRHFGTNFRFEASPEGARGSAYNLLLSKFEPNKPRTVLATVFYKDILVRTGDGWRFKERRSYANALPSASAQ
jgi:hypothetical protein